MKENWKVQEGHLWKTSFPNEIVLCNYFSTNRIKEFGWSGIATKEKFGKYAIGKWIIKYKTNEQ